MIISENTTPSIDEFRKLMHRTDDFLNLDAHKKPDYYAKRGGNPLEDDVKHALDICSRGTSFEGSIIKVSGQKFPDIVAHKYYGVEVKSTKEDHWTSTGSSILETTRIPGVERIYMTFGKLGGQPEFISKPYEDCLYGIAVTHMPRYLINMQLDEGETIFDKMGISYDKLRHMNNPIAPVAAYYRKLLKPGESLWWTGDNTDESVSATIRLWKNLQTNEKEKYTVYGLVNFPEIFAGKYDNFSLWLVSQGIVNPNTRDQFSSGGTEEMKLSSGKTVQLPGVYRRVKKYSVMLTRRIESDDPSSFELTKPVLSDSVELKYRLLKWIDRVSEYSSAGYNISKDALTTYFHLK